MKNFCDLISPLNLYFNFFLGKVIGSSGIVIGEFAKGTSVVESSILEAHPNVGVDFGLLEIIVIIVPSLTLPLLWFAYLPGFLLIRIIGIQRPHVPLRHSY